MTNEMTNLSLFYSIKQNLNLKIDLIPFEYNIHNVSFEKIFIYFNIVKFAQDFLISIFHITIPLNSP